MQLSAELVANAVYDAIRKCATTLRPDFEAGVRAALEREENPRARRVLDQMLENAHIARTDGVPLCQDTGTVWVCLEVGEDLAVPGNVFSLVDDAVARAYDDGILRKSVLADALLNRVNTNTNTPAFCEIKLVPGMGARLHVMLKGGGSDNASRVIMLPPGAGREGIVREVLACVREKAANACPPLLVGIGIGATFDKVAGLAKHALLRPVGSPAASPEAAAFEAELLTEINALGIGPAALGGHVTALAVHVETAPCHIAALPLAINMGCCAMRSASIDLVERAAGSTSTSHSEEIAESTRSAAAPRTAASRSAKPGLSTSSQDAEPLRLTLPLAAEDLAGLTTGQEVLLSGPVYTMRDAGHARALDYLRERDELPFNLAGQTLFYAGPTPAAAGRPLGSVGPTTASRMDFATPALMDAGIVACIGKGKRAPEVIEACKRNGSIYLATVGGVAALLATRVTDSELVAWEDLGTEALRRLNLHDFPAYVAIDAQGRDLYREIEG